MVERRGGWGGEESMRSFASLSGPVALPERIHFKRKFRKLRRGERKGRVAVEVINKDAPVFTR